MAKNQNTAGTAATLAPLRSIEFVLGQADTPDKFCTALAKLFAVRPTEVALMRLEGALLKFLYPDALKTAGAIPVSSSSAIAAHTANAKKAEMFNGFAKVKHASIFESVKLPAPEDSNEEGLQSTIQKLMSAPILSTEQKVIGVIQICRKGYSPSSAGPDFTPEDLKQIELAAAVAAKMSLITGH